MSLSALVVPLLLLAACVGFLMLVFDGENVLLMKYNQYRITQARLEQVDAKQDQSMKGCSQKKNDVLDWCPIDFDEILQVFNGEIPKPKEQVEQEQEVDRINE